MTETQVQVGGGDSKRRGPRLQFLLIGAVVLLVALGAGAATRWIQQSNTKPVVEAPERPATYNKVQDFLADQKTDEASKYINDQLAKTTLSSEERYLLYLEQGSLAFDKGDYQAAADSYTKAAAVKETFLVVRKLGGIWDTLGDKQKAITYYKRALEINPADNPLRESNEATLKELITMLEEQL